MTAVAWLLTPSLGRLRHRLPLLRRLGWRRAQGLSSRSPRRSPVRWPAWRRCWTWIPSRRGLLITADRLINGVPTGTVALLVVPLVSTGLTAALQVFAGVAWARRYWGCSGGSCSRS